MKSSKSKALLLILILSVGVNLFLVGGIVYRVSFQPQFGPRPMPRNVSWLIRDLAEERQSELQPFLENTRAESDKLRREMFSAQRRVNELMTSSEFNSDELETAFTALRSSSDAYQAFSHRQTVEILSRLTPTERHAALEFLQRRGPRSQGRDGDRYQSRPPGPEGGPPDRGHPNNGFNQ